MSFGYKVPVVALTIVIVLSLGFISFKKSSIYTLNDENGESQLASVSSAVSLLKVYISRLGDVLEPYLSPEIIYRREQ